MVPQLRAWAAAGAVATARRRCSAPPVTSAAWAAAAAPPAAAPLRRPRAPRRRPPPPAAARLVVLGIESSCDDTAAAVVTSDGRVLGEAIAGQADIHAAYGGVHPSAASRAHAAAIDAVVESALAAAGLAPSQLSAVAVTVGPGLSLCLDIGVRKARALSRAAALPLIPVHHMEAHALVARLPATRTAPGSSGSDGTEGNSSRSAAKTSSGTGGASGSGGGGAPAFPFLCLLVSGGHNLLVLVRGVGDYLQLGSTLDDALGAQRSGLLRATGAKRQGPGRWAAGG
jgi:N6-L-threonylcarbamoyladenine synthase